MDDQTRPDLISFDGWTTDELLALPDEAVDRSVTSGEPIVFRAGSADVLRRFRVDGDALILELGHIDGGGEGVLPALAVLARRFGRRRALTSIGWRVHAVNCARPNLKLRALLERRGFAVVDVAGTGACYHKVEALGRGPE